MDSDDYMATPIGKLPPPMMQQRTAQPSIENLNYSDLVKEQLPTLNNQATPGNMLPPPIVQSNMAQPPLAPPPPPPPHHHQQQNLDPYSSPSVHTPQPPMYYYTPDPPPPILAAQPEPARKKGGVVESLLSNNMLWITAAAIFGLITYALPRARAAIPSLVDPATGRTTTLGIAGLALLTAALLQGAEKIMKH